ncbi:MAG: tetratricopeptide repeat protein, partial [Rhodothermales bacterium]
MPLSPAPSRVNRQFTDRESFIEAFDETLAAVDPARYDVLVYYGVGGIGKTALRKHLGNHLDAQQDPARWATVNFELAANRNPDNALFLARNALQRKYKFRFPSFDLAYAVYWERTHPQIPLARKELPFLQEGDLLSDVILAVKDVPGLGLVTRLPKAVAKLGGAAQRWWTRRGRADLQELASLDDGEILDRLSRFWAGDLADALAVTGERVVLFLDTYEALWEGKRLEHLRFSLDEWVRQWILHLPGVLWVIAGREKLHWEEWNAEWAQHLHQHLVGKLADEDARRFLLTAGVHDEAVADAIIEGAEGVPFYLDVALDTFSQITAQRTPTPDDFARAPRKVIDRFLKYLDRPERETLNVLSAARAWDRALFEQLVTAFQTGYPPTALPELRRFSFIEDVDVEGEDAGPRWTMHALMRRGLQEHWAEENVAAVHQHLFDHYTATLENLDHRTLDETQRSALGEAFYHGRHVLEPEAFIAWFRQADDAFQQGAQWRLLIPLQEELAGVVEAAYGAEHEQTASALHNLADLYYQQANYEQAEPLYQRSLTIKEQALGPDHP